MTNDRTHQKRKQQVHEMGLRSRFTANDDDEHSSVSSTIPNATAPSGTFRSQGIVVQVNELTPSLHFLFESSNLEVKFTWRSTLGWGSSDDPSWTSAGLPQCAKGLQALQDIRGRVNFRPRVEEKGSIVSEPLVKDLYQRPSSIESVDISSSEYASSPCWCDPTRCLCSLSLRDIRLVEEQRKKAMHTSQITQSASTATISGRQLNCCVERRDILASSTSSLSFSTMSRSAEQPIASASARRRIEVSFLQIARHLGQQHVTQVLHRLHHPSPRIFTMLQQLSSIEVLWSALEIFATNRAFAAVGLTAGHLFAFVRNSEALLAAARSVSMLHIYNYHVPNKQFSKSFDQSDHVFTITLANKKVYVVTEPYFVGQIFSNTSSLSFESFLHDIMFEFGTTEAGIRSVLGKPRCDQNNSAKCKSVSQIAHDMQVRQTQGSELHRLGSHTIKTFQHLLSMDHAWSEDTGLVSDPDSGDRVVWLKRWTAHCFITAGQRAYFGDSLEAIDPTLPSALMEMDDLSWQIFYRYPKAFRPKLQKLCDQILTALRQYLVIPMPERPTPAWFTSELEQQYRVAGLSEEDIATQLLFLYWGYGERRRSAFHAGKATDTELIYRNQTLNAVWLEALRLSAASTALRGITQDFTLGDKVLRMGNQVLVSARQLHLRAQDFGQNIDDFDHKRFLDNPALERSAAFRPFGGGPTMCPGRLLAKYMTLNFVALVYHRFEVALDGPQQSPRYEEGKPSIGIMGGDGDLRIRLTPLVNTQGEAGSRE
nr:cholesterol 7-alpha-monooxygenase [Quercus suber]